MTTDRPTSPLHAAPAADEQGRGFLAGAAYGRRPCLS